MAYLEEQEKDLKVLADAQKSNIAQQIEQKKAEAKAIYDTEQSQVGPQYDAMRTQEAVSTQKQQMNFAEQMANRGLTRSGASAEANIRSTGGMQSRLGAINTQQQNVYDDINRRRTATQVGLEGDLATAVASIQNDYLRNIMEVRAIDYQNQLKLKELQASNSGGIVSNEQTVVDNPLDNNNVVSSATTTVVEPNSPSVQPSKVPDYLKKQSGSVSSGGNNPLNIQTSGSKTSTTGVGSTSDYDMKSILALGKGPLTERQLEQLLKENKIVARITENGKIMFENAK